MEEIFRNWYGGAKFGDGRGVIDELTTMVGAEGRAMTQRNIGRYRRGRSVSQVGQVQRSQMLRMAFAKRQDSSSCA